MNANDVKVGDLVFPTNEAAEELPKLKGWWPGVKVLKVEGEMAEVEVRATERIHVSKLTKGDNAYDPIL